MAGSPRPRSLALGFGAFFALLAVGAWYFAQGLTAPWYGPELSRWVYAFFLIAAAVILAGILILMGNRVHFLERRIVEVEERIPPGHHAPAKQSDVPALFSGASGPHDPVDKDIDEILESLIEMEPPPPSEAVVEQDVLATVATVEAPAPERTRGEDIAKLVAKRERLQRRRNSVTAYLGGPAAVAAGVIALSAIFLPASEGMLQSLHQLNTTAILAMSYAWIGLAAYAIVAFVALMRSR